MQKFSTYVSVAALAVAPMLFSNVVQAQAGTSNEITQGTIGKRTVDVSASMADPSGIDDYAYGTGIGVNLPTTSYLDLGLGYSYSQLDPGWYKAYSHGIGGGATLYRTLANKLKPFVSVGLSYSWSTVKYRGVDYTDDGASWSTGVGVEIPLRWLSITPSIHYGDDFEKSEESSQSWNYGVSFDKWITPKIGVSVGVGYSDPLHSNSYAWSYDLGVRVRF